MRAPGSELTRQSRAFAKEDRARTWRLLAHTVFVLAVFEAGALLLRAPSLWPLRLACTVLSGLTLLRLFIFYHDHLHGALFRRSRVGGLLMKSLGILMLNPPSFWKLAHDHHHRTNCKLGFGPGSIPILSTQNYERANVLERFYYRAARHPVNLLAAYITVFALSMCVVPLVSAPRQHWQGALSLFSHFGLAALLTYAIGLDVALYGLVLPYAISSCLGAYLFYTQHNFPGVELRGDEDWDYMHAALWSSSMFDMPKIMHWFTGNIGYHHVHHVNHRIPFYRLPEAMEALAPLQNPRRTSWRLGDICACLRLKLWDPERREMVAGFRHATTFEVPAPPRR